MDNIPMGDGWFQVKKKSRKPKKEKSSDDDFQHKSDEEIINYISDVEDSCVNYGYTRTSRRERTDNTYKNKPITLEFRNALQKARHEKGYTRKQLATLINEKEIVVESYENGIGSTHYSIINKLNKTLDIVLPKLYTQNIEL